MDTALLGLRVALSLACVLGLIWFAGRRLQGTAAARRQRTVPLSVLGRLSLGKGSGVALVEVAGRVLLLGVAEQGVTVLTEVDAPAASPAPPAAEPRPQPAERGREVREEIDLSLLTGDVPVALTVPALADQVAADEPAREPAAGATLDTPVPTPHPNADDAARFAALAGLAAGRSATGLGALEGSALSPDTWRRAVDVVQRRTARR